MKLKQLGIMSLCLLLLGGCASTVQDEENEIIHEVSDEIQEVINDEKLDETTEEEIVVQENEDDEKFEDVETNTSNEIDNEEIKENPKQESTKKEETVKKEEPVKTPDPTSTPEPTPTPTPKPPVKEETKVEEEKVYGGWHQKDYASTVFDKINQIRANNGLQELPWNDGDTWLANTRVEELVGEVASGTVHSGLKKYDRYVGEIAGYGYGASGVVDAWMESSGHANQILADYNTSMAVGVYYDEYTASNYYIVIFR